MSSYFPLIFISLFLFQGHAQARPVEILSSGELQIALQKLNVLGAVLYIAAHPDDENTNALAYFSQGKKYRTGILTLTRGDGGQNLLGAEKGAEIGIIRTQELLEGRKYDKVEQYFTRAIDFGYSKNREETLEFWGQEQILADMVWVIRKFRPDVIISRSLGGHGNHAAEALLTPEAFTAAGDPKRFPEQLAYIRPWQANRLLRNRSRFNPGTQQELDEMIKIDVGAYDPLLNKSYTEIAANSRSMHKTQGFGAVTTRPGTRNDFYRVIDGATAESDIFDGIDVSWDRIPGGARIGTMLSHIINTFDPKNPSKSIPQLLAVNSEFNQLSDSYWVDLKQQELYRVIQACAGLWMEALSDEKFTSTGDEIQIQTTWVNRTDYPLKI
ncbi:MAG: PIG-L family deacetylase, partial [Candidatus Marinimicrobia bacterium]|nr:PIG-L family deacetylase [Candidatus Neomarinimicrobiota bacterium]